MIVDYVESSSEWRLVDVDVVEEDDEKSPGRPCSHDMSW